MGEFPFVRLRRMRKNEGLRRMVRETRLSVDNLIYPLFLTKGEGIKHEISAMPGQYHLSPDEAVKACQEVVDLGIPAVLLFGLPSKKDGVGTEAWDSQGSVQQGVRALKDAYPSLQVITDVCFCAYTEHGHCGVLDGHNVDNDATLANIGKVALSHVRAGADMVAPSDMMDGRIAAIRDALDLAGHVDVPIMSYAAKYSSAFYGPFREAADSTPQFGDRRSYQMDPANSDEAIREVELDIAEGADILMVKPALSYLDIIYRIKNEFGMPTAAYHVSGEYSMIKAAAERGWVDEMKVMHEALLSIRRAGADLIITYAAKDIAKIL